MIDRLLSLLAPIPAALAAHLQSERLDEREIGELRVRLTASPDDAPDAGRIVLVATLLRRPQGQQSATDVRPEVFHRETLSPQAPVPRRLPTFDRLREDDHIDRGDGGRYE